MSSYDGAGSGGGPAPSDGGAPRGAGPPGGRKGAPRRNWPRFATRCGIPARPVRRGPPEKSARWQNLAGDFDQRRRAATAIGAEKGRRGRRGELREARAPFPEGAPRGPGALGPIPAPFTTGRAGAKIAGFVEPASCLRIPGAAVAKARGAPAGASEKRPGDKAGVPRERVRARGRDRVRDRRAGQDRPRPGGRRGRRRAGALRARPRGGSPGGALRPDAP